MTSALEAAIARGKAAHDRLVANRDALFEPVMAILLIAGPDGARACVAGVVEACIIALEKRGRGEGES